MRWDESGWLGLLQVDLDQLEQFNGLKVLYFPESKLDAWTLRAFG